MSAMYSTRYSIDQHDTIESIDESWYQFARSNGAPEGREPPTR
jgi:hypothetical protein